VSKLRSKSQDKCQCGVDLPWHLVELMETGDRFKHMCCCGRQYALASDEEHVLLYLGQMNVYGGWENPGGIS